jgi:hypothetical protein
MDTKDVSMMRGRTLSKLAVLGAGLFLAACLQFGSSPINLLSARTILREDGSGSNTFLLVVPRADCELVALRPQLDKLKEKAGDAIYYAGYQDDRYKGFELTYVFNSPQQIPEQIEQIKRSVVEALPTPGPGAFIGPVDPDVYGVYDPNQLSIRIDPPLDTLGGKEWVARININPLLVTTPSPTCSVPQITYELVMPGEIKSSAVAADAFDDYARYYVQVTQPKPNTIQWTIQPRTLAAILLERSAGLSESEFAALLETEEGWTELQALLAEEVAQLSETEDGRADLASLLNGQGVSEGEAIALVYIGPVYTLTATSTTPAPLFQIIIRVVAPIVAVLGGLAAGIATIIKIRQSLSKQPGRSQE